ncbi:MAG TPA: RluA family pseudouridine synthase [Bdellovibrionota bacterium]|nr:RluA family pseudouridine synthase [Bdellovibrionota bacterium]
MNAERRKAYLKSHESTSPLLIFESSRWLVFSKPAGWLSIPGRAGGAGQENPPVLLDFLKERYGNVWVVHRLDRETSGVILFARTADDHREANRWFREHQVKKLYDCLAAGLPPLPVFKISQPIEGAASATQVEAREKYREGFLARVRPLSGRRHQIRLHLSGAGYPLWGDSLYQGPRRIQFQAGGRELEIARVALHASKLELPSGEVFEAAWPPDFSGWLDVLRKEGHRV